MSQTCAQQTEQGPGHLVPSGLVTAQKRKVGCLAAASAPDLR